MKRWPLKTTNFWEQAPFFRLLLPLAAGILFYDRGWLPFIPLSFLIPFITATLLAFAALVLMKKPVSVQAPFAFLLLHILLFITGIAISDLNDIKNDRNWFGNHLNHNNTCLARITEIPAEKDRSWKLTLSILKVIDEEGKIREAKGSAFLYLFKDHSPVLFHKGDTLLVPGNWQPIRNAGNPFEFDYARYCNRNNLYYLQSCSAHSVRLYATAEPSGAPLIERSHDWCMAQLEKNITDSKTRGLIQAMLLGDEVNLDEDLRQSYSETGIVHIIAISGGNVSIFFMVIAFLLSWVKTERFAWLKFAVALPLVWFYILMAGAPPSAVRAAIMFSLLAFSFLLQKTNNTLNTLFATAFLLLCAQPGWLFSAGFLLSFTAVLSLILFYRYIYRWYSSKYKLVQWIWEAIAASMAAELLVAPLVVFFFHTFPLFFIIANVAAFVFMNLVLFIGVAICGLFFLPFIPHFLGIITEFLVGIFDSIISFLQGFNPPSFLNLSISGFELPAYYLALTGLVLFIIRKQKPALFVGLCALCLLMFLFCKDKLTQLHQEKVVVYNTGKSLNAEWIKGGYYAVVHSDTGSLKKMNYALKPTRIAWNAWRRDSAEARELYLINGKTILFLNKEVHTEDHFPVDYLVLNYTGKPDLAELDKIFSPSTIVTGNNFSLKQQKRMKKEALDAGIKLHATGIDGALVME